MIDVSELMEDPDFVDPSPITLIRQTSTVNGHGENVLSETEAPIIAIIQAGPGDLLEKLPDDARIKEVIRIWTKTELRAQEDGGYDDIITWHGKRWQVMPRIYWGNWGNGFTKALATLEGVSR